MKKNLFKIITIILSIIFIILVVILITMKVVNGKEKGDRELLTSKISDELSFIDYNVIDAMNKLNNITVTRYKIFNKTVNNEDNNTNSSSKDSSNDKSNSSNGNENQGQENSSEGQSSEQSADQENSENDSSSTDNSSSGVNSSNESSNGSASSSSKSNVKEAQLTLVNSLTETNNQEPNWDKITSIYENLLSTWPTTQLDLKKAGISDEYLENINVDLNGIAQSILNKDKNSCLINLYNLYSQIPVYMEIISKDTYETSLYNTKMAILNAYSLVNNDNKWNEVTSSIKSATSQFEKILNSKSNEKERDNLERIYSMLKNLENTVVLNNKNIFYMQYKNIMQEISNL